MAVVQIMEYSCTVTQMRGAKTDYFSKNVEMCVVLPGRFVFALKHPVRRAQG